MIFSLTIIFILGTISLMGMSWALYKIWMSRQVSDVNQLVHRINPGFEVELSKTKKPKSASKSQGIYSSLHKVRFILHLENYLNYSGLNLSVVQFFWLVVSLFSISFVTMWFMEVPTLGIVFFSIAISIMPYLWVYIQHERRQSLLERQLPNILDFIARSMQAGHDFNSALRLAAQESPKPISEEFQIVFDEVNFGGTIHNAMEGLVERIACPDIRYFAIAVLINREIGGDVASLLKSVATLIRERLAFKDTIYALTAEGRVSAIILGVMPFAVGFLIYFVHPDFISVLWTDETGKKMFAYTLILMIVGALWMRNMVQIKV